MVLPRPEPGLVIRYAYLWRHESDAGGGPLKDRPACLVATLRRGRRAVGAEVVLLPITTRLPAATDVAVELPARVKQHLGLDVQRAWVIVSECNVDIWPTPDLAAIPGRPGAFAYGHLPPRLFDRIRDSFVETARTRQIRLVKR